MQRLSMLALILVAANAFSAPASYFTLKTASLSRPLTLALGEYANKAPTKVVTRDGKLAVLDAKGEVAIACDPKTFACELDQDLNLTDHKLEVDGVVFEALLHWTSLDGETSDFFEVSLRRNRNRTFVAIVPTLSFDWDVAQTIKCNATPKRSGGGFEYAACDYHVARDLGATAAGDLLAKLRANSDVQARLETLKAWNARGLKLYEFIDWRRYQWKELQVDFANPKQPLEQGDVANVFVKYLVNSVRSDGRVLVERAGEYHNHIYRRGLR